MEKTTTYIATLLLVILLVMMGYVAAKLPGLPGLSDTSDTSTGTSLAGSSLDTYNSTTITTSTVSSTVVQVLGSNGNRRMLMIQNLSNNPLFCLLEGSTSAASSAVAVTSTRQVGFLIQTSSTAGQGGLFMEKGYTGVVNCIASGNTTTTIITSP